MDTDRNFTPGGFTHRILKRVAQNGATVDQIREALGQVDNLSKTQRKRLRRHLAILVEDGAIIRCNEWIDILPYGERLLDDLEAQTPGGYAPPSVRFFERRAA